MCRRGRDSILTYDILDLLTQLVNKSLVIVMEHSQSSEIRYRMLETIRQYAREKLLQAEGGENIRQHHLTFFVGICSTIRARALSLRSSKMAESSG